MYKHTTSFPEPIDICVLETLEGIEFETIWSHNGIVSWNSMEEFRKGAPNENEYSIYFKYGNGDFRAKIENGQLTRISHESELLTPTQLANVQADGERLTTALKDKAHTLSKAKDELAVAETDSGIELF